MNKEYKPINNLWKDSEGYRYFGTLKLSSKIKYDGDDFISLWEWVEKLQQENKILKENAEHNDKAVDKVNWENMLLKKENEQLKDNWNKLKEYIDKMHEYFLYTDVNEIYKQNMKVDNPFPHLFNLSELNASDRILSSICKKMQELEQGEE